MLIKSKWVCINRNYVNKELLTEGKVYEIITDTSICPITDIDLNNDNDFIPLEEYRQQQLDKLL